MARSEPDEVQVLRFFEHSEPIERVEAVYNIVAEKVRERLERDGDRNPSAPSAARRKPRHKAADIPAESKSLSE